MIDHARIQTGYDVEILLGSDYFLTILGAAYDSGKIPNEVELVDKLFLHIGKPSSLHILVNSNDTDIEVTLSITLTYDGIQVLARNAMIGMTIEVTKDTVRFKYTYLDDATRNEIRNIEVTLNNPGILGKVEQQLHECLDREIPLDLMSEKVEKFDARKIGSGDGYQDALGLYVNLNLKIWDPAPPRGDLSKAVTFLPPYRSFAIGFNKDTFDRFAADTWSRLGPVIDDGEIVGKFTDFAIHPRRKGFIGVIIKMQMFLDNWPDPDVTIRFHLTPRIDNGIIALEIKLAETDIDTGLLGDALGFLTGSVFASLIGLPLGDAIAGVGGVVTVEITEEVIKNSFDNQAGATDQIVGIDNAFSSFPIRCRIFTCLADPFFSYCYEMAHILDEVKVDTNGMSIAGHSVIETVNEPVRDVMIIDKERGISPGSWNGLISLTYKTTTAGDVVLPIGEVLQRLPLRTLACVLLTPTHIRRKRTVVTDIIFDGGLDIHVAEAIALQGVNALYVQGYRLIRPYSYNPYYRAYADGSLKNNFESLPIKEEIL